MPEMEATASNQALLLARIKHLEDQLVSTPTQHSDQVCKLESEVARLQSSLEQNEAIKQQLQYQLELEQSVDRKKEAEWLVDRHEREEERREREREMKRQHSSLKESVVELSRKCERWKWTLEQVQQARAQEAAEREGLVVTKDREIAELKEKLRESEAVCEEMQRHVKKEKRVVSSLKSSLRQLEGELARKDGEMQKARKELKSLSECALQLQQQLKETRVDH